MFSTSLDEMTINCGVVGVFSIDSLSAGRGQLNMYYFSKIIK